ncbi:methylmalonyl Co-A mutase-associated GTPase MeaB [Parvicella tangerina]|uniref:GTPase n=1 Tax=Parvicella tangerina TaxID=2829795 RepID=A0A916JQC9_9FLAO|nr:methylmalonyl Co-A mutase-associated GTPase MeaB [Parvicella tangerina]CAG5086660.1 putative GTPase [Parvicella tangerina]
MTKSLNSNFKRQRRNQKSAQELVDGILSGNKADLAQGITMLESSKPEHHRMADEIINGCLPHSGKSIRVGITGVPGVGKSTFIEAFGNHLIEQGHKIAVLAIDPSSQKSGGSILGDKTRMETLVRKEEAFVRPSPSKGSLGGVAKATRESIILCEAAGFDFIIVETVGVGQSEIAVRGMVDFFLLLMLAGAGDELQGIKRGIMEMADALVITKADIEEKTKVKAAMTEYKNAMHLFPPHESDWIPVVSSCSAISGEGIEKINEIIGSYANTTKLNGFFDKNRTRQDLKWMEERVNELILESLKNKNGFQEKSNELATKITQGKISPFRAAEQLLKDLNIT